MSASREKHGQVTKRSLASVLSAFSWVILCVCVFLFTTDGMSITCHENNFTTSVLKNNFFVILIFLVGVGMEMTRNT